MNFTCSHFIAGRPRADQAGDWLDVTDPATGEAQASLPIAAQAEVDEAVDGAAAAAQTWGDTPVMERARVILRFWRLLEDRRDELVRLVVIDNGKTLAEAQGEVQRGIEAVEFAAGAPAHLLGSVCEEVARGVDGELFRQPLGVVAGLTPFNFPVMIPLWMAPAALVCGNAFVLKPSERAPLASLRLAEWFAECGAPPGAFNVLHGGQATAELLVAHPRVAAVSVVGSTPVARQVYALAAAHGKRVQALGGAKNALIAMPDARLDRAAESIVASSFGCAGQRCLAGSNLVAVGSAAGPLLERLTAAASALRLGPGIDPATGMGPVISGAARERVLAYIDEGIRGGARLARDGRSDRVAALPGGYFAGPTILENVDPGMALAREEIFGPVLGVLRAGNLEEALEFVNSSPLGNAAVIYTTSGATAREFRRRAEAGMLGVNVGVPAPAPFFPFSGWKNSFFGDLHTQGRDALEFYTRKKVVTSRWD